MVSKATLLSADAPLSLETTVDGDPAYDARTTRRAVSLLLERKGVRRGRVRLEQRTAVPIGCGFGASSASAISAVYAVASALGLPGTKSELARSAHDAEIAERTGVGTVSVAYDFTGAGAITVPGAPGTARFVEVDVPKGTRVVTASLSPYDKTGTLSSPSASEKTTRLGREALSRFLADPSLDNLAGTGEWFSSRLGLATPEVRRLAEAAKSAGAAHASQNMIGFAVHSVVDEDRAGRVASSLKATAGSPRVDTFEIGTRRAGALPGGTRRTDGASPAANPR